jgi:hypothetical protein
VKRRRRILAEHDLREARVFPERVTARMQCTDLGNRSPSAADDDHLASLLDGGQKLGKTRLG